MCIICELRNQGVIPPFVDGVIMDGEMASKVALIVFSREAEKRGIEIPAESPPDGDEHGDKLKQILNLVGEALIKNTFDKGEIIEGVVFEETVSAAFDTVFGPHGSALN